jgi:MoxR-like ATPase
MIEQVVARVRENIQKVIVGKDEVINLVLVAVLCEGHLLIEDVPGTGKTTLAKAVAVSLGCTFRRIQFTPDLLPSDVTGINYFNQKTQEFEFRPGPVLSQIVLADEINRATPRTQSALLEAMQERQITADGETRPLPRPFLIMATQNPVELEGTFPLPEAQLDRFLLRVNIGYPSEDDENAILRRFRTDDPLDTLAAVSNPAEISTLISAVREIRVEESVQNYVVKIARQTRDHAEIALGASPRATMALYRTAQAWAAIHGSSFVTPDHVKFIAPYVLTHRIMVSPQMRLRGRTPEEALADIVDAVPVPVSAA